MDKDKMEVKIMPAYLITAVIDIVDCGDPADYIAGLITGGLCSGDRLKTLWAREVKEGDCDCADRGWYGQGHDSECVLAYAKED